MVDGGLKYCVPVVKRELRRIKARIYTEVVSGKCYPPIASIW